MLRSLLAIFLDYDDTLVPQSSINKAPNAEVISILNTLCNDPKNNVFRVSGWGRDSLDEWFSPCEKLGIAAEHYYFVRYASESYHRCFMLDEWILYPLYFSLLRIYDKIYVFSGGAKKLYGNQAIQVHNANGSTLLNLLCRQLQSWCRRPLLTGVLIGTWGN